MRSFPASVLMKTTMAIRPASIAMVSAASATTRRTLKTTRSLAAGDPAMVRLALSAVWYGVRRAAGIGDGGDLGPEGRVARIAIRQGHGGKAPGHPEIRGRRGMSPDRLERDHALIPLLWAWAGRIARSRRGGVEIQGSEDDLVGRCLDRARSRTIGRRRPMARAEIGMDCFPTTPRVTRWAAASASSTRARPAAAEVGHGEGVRPWRRSPCWPPSSPPPGRSGSHPVAACRRGPW